MTNIKLTTILVAGAALLGAVATVTGADITGKWRAEFDTQIGRQKYLYDFKAEGDKITGKANAEVSGEKRDVELNYLKGRNVPHIWHVDSGAHTFPVWKNDLFLFSRRIFR